MSNTPPPPPSSITLITFGLILGILGIVFITGMAGAGWYIAQSIQEPTLTPSPPPVPSSPPSPPPDLPPLPETAPEPQTPTPPPETLHSTVTTEAAEILQGELDPALIATIIKRHKNQIRYCYERELVKNPQLAGKLTVRFDIDASGAVVSATVEDSSLDNESVESCITSRILRMQFPQPKNGGTVTVTYPFVFQAS